MKSKNSDIEFLRCVAILFVLLAHIAQILSPDSFYWKILNYARFGSGVDLFFCVSGFIITTSLLKKNMHLMSLSAFSKEAWAFYIKRFWRLIPASLFTISLVILLTIIFSSHPAILPLKYTLISSAHAITQTQNIYFNTCRPEGICGELGIFWSLSLENQFYILLPLFLFTFNHKKLVIIMIIIVLSQFFLDRTLNNFTPPLWSFRSDAIALGVLIALFTQHKNRLKYFPEILLKKKYICYFTTAILILLLALFTKPDAIVSFQTGVVSLISGLLVYLCSFNKGLFTSNKTFRTICIYLGSRSYSIYLTHVIALTLTKVAFFDIHTNFSTAATIKYILTFIAITFILSEISYRLVETRFRYIWKKNNNSH